MTKTYWLSFVDEKSGASLGVCVVDVTELEAGLAAKELKFRRLEFPRVKPGAEWVVGATRKAYVLGCNPGGEVMALEVTGTDDPNVTRVPKNRLLSRAELTALGVVEERHEG